ncbi:hypothetical protein [Pseudoxanthomonas koreensis]|uniref:hypothetical protein n=1 Tax=Pseudoxanthomonas koreensis TaxID=266061 RepID=UPI0013915E7F|nr:hypothetical protein [Pseudoxanthomonas koreensis]KAF1692653.1 hypothetical protein CSC64_06605 [Pseudoxanthomonas koreensis]
MADSLPDVFRGAPTYAQIRELERAIAQLPQAEFKETHHFAEGIYGRELFIPAGTVLTGKIHRHSTLNLLMQGRIKVTSEDGMVRELEAPAIFTSPPGCKKVGYALTDTIWVNVHATRLTDIAAIESKFIVPEAPALTDEETLCLGQQ